MLEDKSRLLSRCAILLENSQWEVIPACSSGKRGKTHISSAGGHQCHVVPGTRVCLSDGAPHLGFFCVSFTSVQPNASVFSLNSSLGKAISCVFCKSACPRPGLSVNLKWFLVCRTPSILLNKLVQTLEPCSNGIQQRDLWEVMSGGQRKIFGNVSSLVQRLAVVYN